MKNEIQILKST